MNVHDQITIRVSMYQPKQLPEIHIYDLLILSPGRVLKAGNFILVCLFFFLMGAVFTVLINPTS